MPSLNQLTEKQAIDAHLNDRPPISLANGIKAKITSGFWACLCDARRFTGRDSTGAIVDFDKSQSWLGNIGYLILLDQIGSCFKDKNKSLVCGSSIQKALTYFSDLTKPEIDTIYALRCALAHDYSLINIPKKRNQLTLQHQFILRARTGKLVTLPDQRWDGNIQNTTLANLTFVDVGELGNLVEGVYSKLLSLAANNSLEIVLSGGKNELINRYTFGFQLPP
jgi:hypothetical protein